MNIRNWIVLVLVAVSCFSCVEHDVPPDTLSEPTFFLKGDLDGDAYDVEVGINNIEMRTDRQFHLDSMICSIGELQHSFQCTNDCEEKLLFDFHSPDGINPFNTNINNVLSIGEKEFVNLNDDVLFFDTAEKVRIIYTNKNGTRYDSSMANNDDLRLNVLELEAFLSQNFSVGKLKVEFDCYVKELGGDKVLYLKDFEGVIAVGFF